MPPTPSFQIQICLYPLFNGGFYVNYQNMMDGVMRVFRASLFFFDIRFAWESGRPAEIKLIAPLPGSYPFFVLSVMDSLERMAKY